MLLLAASALLSAAAPVLEGSLVGRQVFSADNWWNLDVSAAPLDSNSAAFIDFISGRSSTNPTAKRQAHPDFGPPPYGIPYVVVSGDQPLVTADMDGVRQRERQRRARASAGLSDS